MHQATAETTNVDISRVEQHLAEPIRYAILVHRECLLQRSPRIVVPTRKQYVHLDSRFAEHSIGRQNFGDRLCHDSLHVRSLLGKTFLRGI